MKKMLAAVLCASMLFCTGISAHAADTENPLIKFSDAMENFLTEEQIQEIEDITVDILTNETIMKDATFLIDSFSPEQQDAFSRLITNIFNLIADRK